jgi:hypothetical protein
MQGEIGRDEDWDTIESKLPANWRELAREHGVLIEDRRRTDESGSGWKIRDPAALLRMILHHATSGASLRTTVALAAALGLAEISGAAFHKWMRKCGGWLAALVAEMTSSRSTFRLERWAGYEVIAADATTAQMPGAKGTTAYVHYALRLFDLCSVGIKVSSNKVGESLRNFVMKAGQLWIADRGYCNANSVAHAASAKAVVLIRFAFGPLPLFDAAGAKLDLRKKVLAIRRPGAIVEWPVCLHPRSGEPIVGRLIARRLTDAQAQKARDRLAREHGRSHVTREMLAFSNFVLLFTTVPKDRLSASLLTELYTLRWQVELEFKRDKSIAGLDTLPNRLDETIHSWICAKMLALELSRRLAEPSEPFPPSIVGSYALRVRASRIAALANRDRT